MALELGVPPTLANLVQKGLIERAFHDGLYPNLMYRSEALAEEWGEHQGSEIFMSRPGLLPAITTELTPGADPLPQTVNYEQWIARLGRWGGTIDTHMPTSAVASQDLYIRNIHQLGLQAGQSLNRISRDALFQSYLSGHTVLIAAAAAGDTTIRVASLNGFTDVVIVGTNVRPEGVSVSRPLTITIAGVAGTKQVIGALADDPADPIGPGTLTLSAAVGGGGAPIRSAVLSVARPQLIRSGGGNSIDAIGAGDTFVLQDVINAVNRLRRQNVPPHEDGYYHAHITTDANSQVFTDPAFQRLNTALPDHKYYQEAFIGTIAGCAFLLNTEAPDDSNSGEQTLTGALSIYSKEVGAETVNKDGVRIGRTVITGRGAMNEMWKDESVYVSEAGVTGKVGAFSVTNAGVEIKTERIRLILRAPLNRLQDVTAATWSSTTSFPIPSDVATGSAARFKRAVVIESALDAA